MVAPAIPLVYWGIGILLAGGAAVTARRIQEEEIGRVELPDSIAELFENEPQPDPEEDPEQPRPFPPPFDYETETRTRKRCEDDPEQDCDICKALTEGSSTLPRHTFAGGTVRRPSPRARGALYQHYVVGWLHFEASADEDNNLEIQIEEWNWKLGVQQSWDGLVFSECRLLECKLGYRDYLNPSAPHYRTVNPQKPFLGTLAQQFTLQLRTQHSAIMPDWPQVSLDWVFSDQEVMWQFIALRDAGGMTQVGNRYVPFHLAPSGTDFVREQFSDGSATDYGYWEDV
ncbi:Tox-REase-5 domain-containing protein [Tritonibacter mobilis]|uniref:Tox-REase-5 domain-containing protein n=1 Tax=Tritonibacter mobilis TaxID=379347 RepID=UPI001C0A34E4|nr:Tox-REase-5 domain-containing protein [Tritonibacter mobilis]MBU3033115.1 restriction endonuclease fold toxin 5 domain-containing protein [Tritonibacter mobilis]WHQ82300.1 Tox-REase-5 domain-containing protein [Tritonibacter mobilis]